MTKPFLYTCARSRGLRATWAYRSLVARNLVLEFIEEQKEVA